MRGGLRVESWLRTPWSAGQLLSQAAVSKRLFGSDRLFPVPAAKWNLALAVGCYHFAADLSIDISLGSCVLSPGMNECIRTETNKL